MKNEFVKAEPLVTVTGVSLSLCGKTILRDIGSEKEPLIIHNVTRPNMLQGQTIAVVGASGSGKSTLFKLLAGIVVPTTGTIIIPNEREAGKYKQVEGGDVGFVQQNYPLSRNQSVYEMLMDAMRQSLTPKNEWQGVIEDYLEKWHLIDQRNSAANKLSGGQKQRVAIIEQLLCSHHYMIFDEPFSGLDVLNIDDVKRSFSKITTTDSTNTIFFSTHDIHLAVELADTVIVIGFERNGKNQCVPGGTIIAHYDLMDMGIAWQEYGPPHRELNAQIQNLIKNS